MGFQLYMSFLSNHHKEIPRLVLVHLKINALELLRLENSQCESAPQKPHFSFLLEKNTSFPQTPV